MALGNNMKVDRLIPLTEENHAQDESPKVFDSSTAEEINSLSEKTSSDTTFVSEMTLGSDPVVSSEDSAKSDLPLIVYESVETDSLKMIFTPSRRKTQKRILINIEGALTINNVEVLYSKVNVVFDNYDFVEVTMSNVSEIDLTVIQLFHAIRVSYWSQKKYISINAEFSRDDRKLLNTCGFTEFQTQKTDA